MQNTYYVSHFAGFVISSEKALEARDLVSLRIVKTRQAHTSGKNLALPATKDIVLTLFNKKAANEFK
ncbi:hypothetical protein X975_06018, partial [Stegodyphus mimosarum]